MEKCSTHECSRRGLACATRRFNQEGGEVSLGNSLWVTRKVPQQSGQSGPSEVASPHMGCRLGLSWQPSSMLG